MAFVAEPTSMAHDSERSPELRLSASSLVRDYINSLPNKVSIREELSSYQFWKSIRTEFLATFLFFVFIAGTQMGRAGWSSSPMNGASSNSTQSLDQIELKSALALGMIVSTLVQCTGHVSGCHLSIAITLGMCVSGRVSSLRLALYLFAQSLASCAAAVVIYSLYGTVPAISPAAHVSAAQVFAFEFLATFLVVLTYLANCDPTRIDLGFKAFSIGLAFTAAHLFAFPSSGASLSPARALAASLLSSTWYLHWIYWVSPFVAGLFGGITYEYIGSIKPIINRNGIEHDASSTELKHQFTGKPTHSPSGHSMLTSPSCNFPIQAMTCARSQSQQSLQPPLPVQASPNSSFSNFSQPSPLPEVKPQNRLPAETNFGSLEAPTLTSPSKSCIAGNGANAYRNGVIMVNGTGRW